MRRDLMSRPARFDGALRGRRMSWQEFREIVHDRQTETEARSAGLPVPPATARRRLIPAPAVVLNLPPPPKPRAPVAANDNGPAAAPVVPTTVSTPDRIPNALRKSSPALYRTLCRLRELARPAELDQPDLTLASANDNTGVDVDYRHDIDPGNVEDLLDAYADGMRSRVVVHRNGTVERFEGGVKYTKPYRGNGEIVEIGGRSSRGRFFGMRFHRGALVAYAKNGKRVTPSYDIGDARGSDDAEMPRETTASPSAHPALAEIDRADAWADFLARTPAETARMLRVILDADNFQEVARAADLTPTAHNGRRVTEKMLAEAEKLLAA